MAQVLPMLSQFLANPAIIEQLALEGKKVAVDELIRVWFETAEMKDIGDMIVQMTPQDLQRQQQMSQGGMQNQKFQQQQALAAQKEQAQSQQADAENIARASRDVLRLGFKQAVEPEELTGSPYAQTQGFGSEV